MTENIIRLRLSSLEAMAEFAYLLASVAKKGDVFTLTGDLGVGKTCFVRYFITSYFPEVKEVTSPTFSLAHIYENSVCPIWHLDLYRLESADEVSFLGLEDAIPLSITLIEWPQLAQFFLPNEYYTLEFSFGETADMRYITLSIPSYVQGILDVTRFIAT